MKVISWNIQGAKKDQIREEVKFLTKTEKHDVLFLLETKPTLSE